MAAWLSYNAGIIGLRRAADPPTPPGMGGRSLRSIVRGGTSCTAAHLTAPSVARPRSPWARSSLRAVLDAQPPAVTGGRAPPVLRRSSVVRSRLPSVVGAALPCGGLLPPQNIFLGAGAAEKNRTARVVGKVPLRRFATLPSSLAAQRQKTPPPLRQKKMGGGAKARPSLGPQNRTEG